jgi:hypothetical protein
LFNAQALKANPFQFGIVANRNADEDVPVIFAGGTVEHHLEKRDNVFPLQAITGSTNLAENDGNSSNNQEGKYYSHYIGHEVEGLQWLGQIFLETAAHPESLQVFRRKWRYGCRAQVFNSNIVGEFAYLIGGGGVDGICTIIGHSLRGPNTFPGCCCEEKNDEH